MRGGARTKKKCIKNKNPINKMKIENTISYLIIGWMTFSIGCIGYVISGGTNSHMFAIGPNENFYILGIGIDTLPKYWLVVSFCFINSGMRAFNLNVLHSWIINEIQDVNNISYINPKKAYAISNIALVFYWYDFFMYMNILFSQIDMLVVEVVSDLIATYILTRHYLSLKSSVLPM
jgi:hypothetical protein